MKPAAPARRRAWVAFGGILAAALALRVAGLASQPLIPDDGAVGQTARAYVEHGWPEPTMWNHPRLRDALVYLSLDALGEGPWGLKAWSVLFGVLSVPAAALVAWLLTGSGLAAAIAAAVLAVDPLHLDFSRQAINDVYLAFFPVAAVAMLLRYGETRTVRWLVGAGVALGLGLASKWSAVFPVGAAAALVLLPLLHHEPRRQDRAAELAAWVGCLVALPLALYLLTFAPWFSQGHDLAEWLRLQAAMARETSLHVGYPGTKLPGYPGEIVSALRWFLAPAWYVDYVPPVAPASEGIFVIGIGNPVTWFATLPALGWAAWRSGRARDRAAGCVLALFLAAYLPFVVVPRPIWTNSAMSVLPFHAILLGWAAARLHARAAVPVRIWAAAALASAALLWLPAVGARSAPSDRAVRVLLSPEALDPRNRPPFE
jgi:4-amino-4-deoxy-L-arabinose transferase-like glycosyltransferase